MTTSYDLLSRDMREFIYKKGWPSLTKIQDAAIKQMYKCESVLKTFR